MQSLARWVVPCWGSWPGSCPPGLTLASPGRTMYPPHDQGGLTLTTKSSTSTPPVSTSRPPAAYWLENWCPPLWSHLTTGSFPARKYKPREAWSLYTSRGNTSIWKMWQPPVWPCLKPATPGLAETKDKEKENHHVRSGACAQRT